MLGYNAQVQGQGYAFIDDINPEDLDKIALSEQFLNE